MSYEIDELLARIDDLERLNCELEDQVSELDNTVYRLEQQIEDLEQSVRNLEDTLEETVDSYDDAIYEVKDELESMTKDRDRWEELYEDHRSELSAMLDECYDNFNNVVDYLEEEHPELVFDITMREILSTDDWNEFRKVSYGSRKYLNI